MGIQDHRVHSFDVWFILLEHVTMELPSEFPSHFQNGILITLHEFEYIVVLEEGRERRRNSAVSWEEAADGTEGELWVIHVGMNSAACKPPYDRFLPNPFGDGIAFRTGHMVVKDPNEQFKYVRSDDAVRQSTVATNHLSSVHTEIVNIGEENITMTTHLLNVIEEVNFHNSEP